MTLVNDYSTHLVKDYLFQCCEAYNATCHLAAAPRTDCKPHEELSLVEMCLSRCLRVYIAIPFCSIILLFRPF